MDSQLDDENINTSHVIADDVTNVAMTSREPLSDRSHVAIVVYLSFLGCVAAVGNVTVLLAIVGQRWALKKMQNVLLINMAAVDLLVTLTAYPLTAVASSYRRWIFGNVACQCAGFLVFMLSMVSMNTLTFIAIFRYVLVCKPKRHDVLTVKNSVRAIIASWVHALLWTSLPLLGWSRYVREPFGTACSLDWTSTSGDNTATLLYVLFTALICYVVHVAVIVFCYAAIWRTSRSLTFGAGGLTGGGGEGGGGGAEGGGRGVGGGEGWGRGWSVCEDCGGQGGDGDCGGGVGGGGRGGGGGMMKLEEVLWRHKVETERGVTRMCAVMVMAYLVCWTPYTVFSFMAVGGRVVLSTSVTTLPTMFAKLSCALNPIIYALMSAKFRRVLLDIMTSWWRRDRGGRGGGGRVRGDWRLRGMGHNNRVANRGIELQGRSARGEQVNENQQHSGECRGMTVVREYRGDITNQGVYIGNLSLSLEAQPSVF